MKKQIIIPVCFLALLMVLSFSCKKERSNGDECFDDKPISPEMVAMLNSNTKNLQKLAACYLHGDQLLSCAGMAEKSESFQLDFRSGMCLQFSKLSAYRCSSCPNVSMVLNDSVFLWTINNKLLTFNGVPAKVNSGDDIPELAYEDGTWSCHFGAEKCFELDAEPFCQILFDTDLKDEFLIAALPTGCILTLPLSADFSPKTPEAPNQAYYKSVFLDAGIGLNPRKWLAAVSLLGLSMECMSISSNDDSDLQDRLIAGDSIDYNGRLLYPDGQPRYQLLFVNGGKSKIHGQSLTDQARDNMRSYYENGGSYLGACAGAFFASNGDNHQPDYPYYLHIWPQVTKRTALLETPTGFFVEPHSPLLSYYDFGGDLYLDSVWHNGGCYADEQPVGGEVLARYDYPELESIHLQPSAWAYKGDQNTGRIIQFGSHPEKVSSGEQRDFTAAALLYAIEGRGLTRVKGSLQNGIRRYMTKTTLDCDPDYTMIGDLQCHHFVVYIPEGVNLISISLLSDVDADFTLMLNKDSFAYENSAQYVSSNSGSNHRFLFSKLPSGLWYLTVKCNTTVTTFETDWGEDYSGRTDVLNGVPYSVKVSWSTPEEQLILKGLPE